MRKEICAVILLSALSATWCYSCSSHELSKEKTAKIHLFLRNAVKDARQEDYHRHNIDIEIFVTGVKIERVTTEETAQDNGYLVYGKASYIIKGNRRWQDKEGNIIELEPEQEITRWFSCGILEDKYIGVMFIDTRNLLTFYADNPMR